MIHFAVCLGVCGKSTSSPTGFREWADKRGVLFPKLEIATFSNGLRGMRAAEPLKAEDVVVKLPRESALLIEPNTKAPELCPKDVWKSQPWYVKLALRLMLERRAGLKSYYSGYVASLPQAIDLPCFWPREDLAQLGSPPLVRSLKKQKEEWMGVVDGLVKDAPGLITDQGAFLSCLSLVRSRSFSGPYIGSSLADRIRLGAVVGVLAIINILIGAYGSIEQTANAVLAVATFNVLYEILLSQHLKVYLMAPGVDLMNHSSRVECDLSYDYFSDGYSVTLDRGYQPGDQVFISYGKKSNDDLLQFFGFVESDNPYDVVKIENGMSKLRNIVDELSGSSDRSEAAQTAEVCVYREGFSPEVMKTLKLWIRQRGLTERMISTVLLEFCQREISILETHLTNGTSQRAELISHFKKEKIAILRKCAFEVEHQDG